jgi:hypothetical protein
MSEVGAHVTGMETIVKRIVKRVADIETKGNAPWLNVNHRSAPGMVERLGWF